jgi:hypothetical protein
MDALKDGRGFQPSLAEVVFRNSQLCYPVVLLFAFIISAGIHSIVTSKTEEEVVAPTVKGPGGKPLPFTKRRREHHDTQAPFVHNGDVAKTVFQYLSAGLVLSFIANGAAIALRALSARGVKGEVGDWWCDEQRIVSLSHFQVFGPNGLSNYWLDILTTPLKGLRCWVCFLLRICSHHFV